MANRVKEDEKNERTIRSLLKLTENRRCINCNSLGPQYVCTNFSTFVCTACSGMHREFTHRVKSVSMAKFTSQEVAALQGGGNARAKESLLKEWDPQHNSLPDSSNVERLRDFIKHVYVDRRYTGEKGFEKPPKVKVGEDSYENRRTESYQGGSRSPPYEDTYERRYSDRPSPGGRSDDSNSRYDERRSPGYDSYGRSPVRPEVVNDWRREDRFSNGNRKTSDGDSRSGERSPVFRNDKDIASPPPIVRPVRDILGDNVTPLRISEPPKVNGARAADSFANTLRTSSSGSLGSVDGNPVEPKRETLGSLIDFDSGPEPPVKAAVQQPQQTFTAPPTVQTTSTSSDTNWASFDMPTEAKVSHFPSSTNNLESLFSQLSIPAAVPSNTSPAVPVLASISPVNSLNQVNDAGQWPTIPGASFHSSGQLFTSPVIASNTQPWNPSFSQNAQGIPSNTNPALKGNSSFLTQPSPVEAKSTGRSALPEDLFAAAYPILAPNPGWQPGPPGGMGYPVQYNTAVPNPTFIQPSKLTNPFDLNNELPPVQAPPYPSMPSMHGAMPNMPLPTGLMRTSSLGAPVPAWMSPQPSSYASTLPPQPQPFTSSGGYMGQQNPNNMPPSWHQGVGGFGHEGSAFGSVNSNQHMPGGYSAPAAPSFPSTGGNPFG